MYSNYNGIKSDPRFAFKITLFENPLILLSMALGIVLSYFAVLIRKFER
jgi:hypothetical protein